ncbi:MAG: CaiB/BaiF CoA-transferase family protein [Gammaproteobacteria bacterium]|nr:MAG: CaiB/BaiF CoA-transferase family protein [Gammaproteobacteria bacterium]
MQRPLSGIRVVGTDQYMAGPYCTMLLGDAGAEVIKIERPGSGDPRRSMPPFAERDGNKKAAGFMGYNRNKKSVALDIRSETGGEIFRRLMATSDVLVNNLRPGALTRMGFGYDDLKAINPRLIYAVISGFGRLQGYQGPYGDRPAFDIVAEAMGGIMHLVGFEDKPPSWTIYGMADIYSGMVTAYGVMQALFMRERTGEGQMVDSAMYDNMLSLNESMLALYSVAGQSPHRGRPRNAYPRGAYRTRDGYIALNVPDERIWQRLAEAMGHAELADDERTCSGPARAANRAFLDPIIEAWMENLTRAEVVDKLNQVGVPTGPVHTAEDVFECPQVEARGMLMAVNDPEVGEYRFARTPPHLSAATELPANPAPRLGEHTRAVLEGVLGYTADEVDAFAADGVVQLAD